MNNTAADSSIPAAWLRPLPDGYKIPLWRWIIVPATTIMLKRNAGIWMSGTLTLTEGSLSFVQTKITKSSRKPPEVWAIPLADISTIDMEKGLASERIEVRHCQGVVKLMSVRSSEFVTLVRQALLHAPLS